MTAPEAFVDWATIPVADGPKKGPIAAGGDLDPALVYSAYRHGLYPIVAWNEPKLLEIEERFGDGLRQGKIVAIPTRRKHPLELTWVSPDPRAIVRAADVREGKNVRRVFRRSGWTSSVDRAFEEVVDACRAPYPMSWITPEITQLFYELHGRGLAHSIEIWDGGQLVGGTYGVLLGGVFSGESSFHRVSDASRAAFADLGRRLVLSGVTYIDSQELSPHLATLGETEVPRAHYLELLYRYRDAATELFTEPMRLSDWPQKPPTDGTPT
jgi:leucyl/phenylalanyl-tRNA--protein transferase